MLINRKLWKGCKEYRYCGLECVDVVLARSPIIGDAVFEELNMKKVAVRSESQGNRVSM